MYPRSTATRALRLTFCSLIVCTGLFVSQPQSGAAERPAKHARTDNAAKSPPAHRNKHFAHRSGAGETHRWYPGSGFVGSIYDDEEDEQSPDFGVSLGNGCWDLPQYARLYGCDQDDLD